MLLLLWQALKTFTAERRRQAAALELSRLSDHQLADIGLRRDQLPTLALDLSQEQERSRDIAHGVARSELQPCG
jgi:uncharacterized protein YjiS (DUF1127 family)